MATNPQRTKPDKSIDVTDPTTPASRTADGARPVAEDRPISTTNNGHAVASLVLGLLAATYAFLAFTAIAAVLFGLLAIGFGIKGLSVSKDLGGVHRGLAISGIVSGALGLLLGIAVIAGAITLGSEIEIEDLPQEIQDTIQDVTG